MSCNMNCNMDCNIDCNMDCNMGNTMGSNVDCDMLLKQVYQASFALDDVVLFLDTHPCDKDALKFYCYVSDLRRRAVEAYEEQCGPLMIDGVMDENYWTWINDPWPWEGVCG